MAIVGNMALIACAAQGGLALPQAPVGWRGLFGPTLLCGAVSAILFAVLPKLGVVGNSAIMNIEPISALVLAWAILGRSIAAVRLSGGLLVVATVMRLGLRRG